MIPIDRPWWQIFHTAFVFRVFTFDSLWAALAKLAVDLK